MLQHLLMFSSCYGYLDNGICIITVAKTNFGAIVLDYYWCYRFHMNHYLLLLSFLFQIQIIGWLVVLPNKLVIFDIPRYLYTIFYINLFIIFFSFLVVYIFPNSFKLFPLKHFQIHQFHISLLDQGVFDHINYKNVYQIIKLHNLYNISLYTRVNWITQFLLLYYLFILFVNCYI